MSTRGLVGRLNADGSVDAIYNHFDSYFDSLGRDLPEEFNSSEKVDALIARGDGSYVLDKKGYEDGAKRRFKDLEEYNKTIDESVSYEYGYIFKDGEWFGKESAYIKQFEPEGGPFEFTPLEQILDALKE